MPTPAPTLVTGAAGFIGARLVESLNQRSAPVISVDESALFAARPEHRNQDFGTIIDRDELIPWLQKERPELAAIYHLGACSDTRELDEDFLERINVQYSKDLWSWCTEQRTPLHYASSAATYGLGEAGYADDESRMGDLKPLNPYGWSKLHFDIWALEQEQAGQTPPRWTGWKFFNVYGFGERHKDGMASVVLKAFDQIQSGQPVRLFRSHHPDYANGEQQRDFVSVEDVIRVMHFAEERPLTRGIYNLGTGKAETFLALVHAVFQALGREPEIEFIDTPEDLRPRYQYFTEAEMGKLRGAGYGEPFLPLAEGVRRYVERLVADAAMA